jgi:DnaJ-class molecular chaperone
VSDDEGEYIECPDCEGTGTVVVDMRWKPTRWGDRWDDVWEWCELCEGKGKLRREEHANE